MEEKKGSGGFLQKLLYDPRTFLGLSSVLALAVLGGWALKLSRSGGPAAAQREEVPAAPPTAAGVFPAASAPRTASLPSSQTSSLPSAESLYRTPLPALPAAGSAPPRATISPETSAGSRALIDRIIRGKAVGGAAAPVPVQDASLQERVREALAEREKAAEPIPEEAPAEKPVLKPMGMFQNTGFSQGGAVLAKSAPLSAARPTEVKPHLQPPAAVQGGRDHATRSFFRPAGQTLTVAAPGPVPVFSGQAVMGGGESTPLGNSGSKAAASVVRSPVSTTAGAPEAPPVMPAAPRVSGVGASSGGGGGGGVMTQMGSAPQRDAATASADHIRSEARKRLDAANRYKSSVVLPLVAAEWSNSAFPALQAAAAQAEARLRALDEAVLAARARFTDRSDITASFDELHQALTVAGSAAAGNDMAGRLADSRARIGAGLRDVALLPVGCSFNVQVPQALPGDPSFPRAAREDMTALGRNLPEQVTTGGGCIVVGPTIGCPPGSQTVDGQVLTRTYATESVHDSAVSAHRTLDFAVRQADNVRLQALQTAEMVPQELAQMEGGLSAARAQELRALGARARADLLAAAALIPGPPALLGGVAIAGAVSASKGMPAETTGLLDDFRKESLSYPDTANRRNAANFMAASHDASLGATNVLNWFNGGPGQPLKGLTEAGEEASRCLVAMCDAYQSMLGLAGDVK